MDDCICGFKCIVPAILGIILGVVIGTLVNTGVIVGFLPIVWAAFGIALFSILLLVLISVFGDRKEERCVCKNGTCLVIGAIGTVLLALAILAVIATVPVATLAVLFGIGGFFFIFNLVSLFQLLLCLADATCNCRD